MRKQPRHSTASGANGRDLFRPTPEGATALAAGPAETGTTLGQFLSVKDAAGLLGISTAHLRREIRLKHLAVHRIGRLVRIAEADLASYLARRRRGERHRTPVCIVPAPNRDKERER